MWLTWPWVPVWPPGLSRSQGASTSAGKRAKWGRLPSGVGSRLNAKAGALALMARNGSWNEWPRISSAISATGVVRRAVCAGSGPEANSRASRNA